MTGLDRRAFLRLLMAGCGVGAGQLEAAHPRPRPAAEPPPPWWEGASEHQLARALVMALGPWSAYERSEAARFADSFLEHHHGGPPAGVDPRRLVARIVPRGPPIEGFELESLSEPERAYVLGLVDAMYRTGAFHAHARGEPPFGECLADARRHTRSPESLGLAEPGTGS